MAAQFDIGVEIGVVGVEQRPVGDGAGQIGRETAARIPVAIDGEDMPVVVEADFVIHDEVMALAGGDHVVVAVGTNLDRAIPAFRGDGGNAGEQVHLRFLAAKAAAHAAHVHDDRMAGHVQNMGDHVLHLGRVLGRDIDDHILVLAGHGHGDLTFEIEVILPADAETALDATRRRRHRGTGIAAPQGQRIGHIIMTRIPGGDRIQREGQGLILDLCLLRSAAGLIAALGDNGEDRLAPEQHMVLGEDRIVMLAIGRDIVDARQVGGGQHAQHAGMGQRVGEIHAGDPAMRAFRQAQIGMDQTLRLGKIVGVVGPAGDMLDGAVMGCFAVGQAADGGVVLHRQTPAA